MLEWQRLLPVEVRVSIVSGDQMDLVIDVDIEGADASRLDDQTRQLLHELRAEGFDAQLRSDGTQPPGSKAVDAMAIASLVLPLVTAVAPKLIDLIKEWRSRDKRRTVTVSTRRSGVVIRIERFDEEHSSTQPEA